VSDWESDLVQGIAQYLEDQGVGSYRSDDTAYATDETAIVFGELPSAPDRAIGLSLYSSTDHPVQNLSSVRLQLMCRGNANDNLDVGAIATAAFAALQGVTSLDLGTAHVIQIGRVSAVPTGVDGNRRYTRADNYQLDVNTPYSAGRTP